MTGIVVPLDLSSPARGPRGKPPRHFADLAPDERAAALTALGQSAKNSSVSA